MCAGMLYAAHRTRPYDDLATLHRDMSNHAETAITMANQTEGQTLVSISHSVVDVSGKLHVSVLLVLEEQ